MDCCDYVFKIPFDCETNYCELEVKNYTYAVDHKLEKFFAKSFYLTSYCALPCYCMEKVDVDEYFVERSLRNYYYSEDGYEYGAFKEDEAMVEDLFRTMYSNAVVDTLYDFLSEYKINDIHCSNVGVNKKGEMVIIDYSGF